MHEIVDGIGGLDIIVSVVVVDDTLPYLELVAAVPDVDDLTGDEARTLPVGLHACPRGDHKTHCLEARANLLQPIVALDADLVSERMAFHGIEVLHSCLSATGH